MRVSGCKGALPVYCQKASLQSLTCHRLLHTLRAPRPCTRAHVPAFCMSLRTSAHTGVAIRIPAEKPGKSVVLRANSSCFSYSPKVLLLVLPHCKENGLLRRFAPRNDMQKFAACPRLQGRTTRQARNRLRIRLKCYVLFCAAAGVTDCHVASLLAMTCRNLPRVRACKDAMTCRNLSPVRACKDAMTCRRQKRVSGCKGVWRNDMRNM